MLVMNKIGYNLSVDSIKRKFFRLLLNAILFSFFNVIGYTHEKMEISQVLLKIIAKEGLDAAIGQHQNLKKTDSTSYDFREEELCDLGFCLLGEKRFAEAVEICELNIESFPVRADHWLGIGEAYMLAGQGFTARTMDALCYEI